VRHEIYYPERPKPTKELPYPRIQKSPLMQGSWLATIGQKRN